ncbi:hypothetical protein BCR36DRAFT_152412 [Piromyces finnis]|uniref:Homeobox domain-containing protein n=1 Tax=Piromyces finnis TaxID=1754191 RepID=A0A1Y1VJE9_9FUNG|nr:hypothetical protein BCR36DRAFT_152412 [Piromyces finnis]|eukprot:ORX57151.1 hypothetical protein BCR36DRAFT_152412 [Piromyces finnis]
MLSAADITTLDNTGGALANPTFPNPNGSTMWAPTFYDPFQVKHRRRTSKKQFSILEKAFNENPKPNAATRRDLAEQLKMTVRGVQVWFQNRRAKAKAQKLKMSKAQKNGSAASSPSENSSSNNNESSTESSSETVNTKKESSESHTDKTASSPSSTTKELKDDVKSTLDMESKLKLDKDYPLLSNPYFQVDDDANQGVIPFADTPDYFFDKQDPLNQGFGPSPLSAEFYGSAPLNMNRRCRAKSLPNVFHLGMYVSPQQQQLANPLNQTLPFQGLHQHPQLPTQAQSYSLFGGQKAASGSYSPQSLQFLRQKSPYSPNTFLYTQKAQSLPSMGPSNDSTASSPSLGSEKGSQTRLSAGLAKHPDHIFYGGIDGTGINRSRGYVNYIASPGLGDNIPSPHSSTSNGYSPSYQSFIPDVATINGIRPIEDSLGYMNNPYGLAQQTLSNPYAGNIQNFVPDLNAGTGVLQGIPSYPSGFNPGRRSSCPPEFLASVNSLQLSLDDNLTKQKGLETIQEDESIE